jgi:hypothetical protein
LPGDANEDMNIRRLQPFRGKIILKRLGGLELSVEGITFRNEILGGLGSDGRAKQRRNR